MRSFSSFVSSNFQSLEESKHHKKEKKKKSVKQRIIAALKKIGKVRFSDGGSRLKMTVAPRKKL